MLSEESARVLVVEDDDEIASVVAAYLRREGYTVERAADGLTGLELCRQLRAQHANMPIIFLTARGEVSDQVLGLGTGRDDYVVKPFSPAALVARVRAQLGADGNRCAWLRRARFRRNEPDVQAAAQLTRVLGQRDDCWSRWRDALLVNLPWSQPECAVISFYWAQLPSSWK